jgi:hypothetical protein
LPLPSTRGPHLGAHLLEGNTIRSVGRAPGFPIAPRRSWRGRSAPGIAEDHIQGAGHQNVELAVDLAPQRAHLPLKDRDALDIPHDLSVCLQKELLAEQPSDLAKHEVLEHVAARPQPRTPLV